MTRPTCARLSPRDPTHAGSEYATRTVDTWAERSRRSALRAGFCRAFEVLRVRVLWTRRAQSRGLWNRLTADRVLTVVCSAGRPHATRRGSRVHGTRRLVKEHAPAT